MSAIQTLKAALPVSVVDVMKRTYHGLRNRSFTPYLKHKSVEGVEFDLWICDRDGRIWYDLTATDPDWPEMRFMRDHIVGPGDVVLECGGHHGCTATLISNWVGPGGKVVTFEALPRNCDIIQRNIDQNRLTNVRLERKAIGAAPGWITVDNASNASVGAAFGAQVEMTPIDAYAHLKPTVLKIDVEGFEVEALKGAAKVMRSVPKLAIEVHDPDQIRRYGSSVDDLLRLIGPERYRFWIQRDESKAPVEYDLREPITARCHLFAVPR